MIDDNRGQGILIAAWLDVHLCHMKLWQRLSVVYSLGNLLLIQEASSDLLIGYGL